MYVAKNVLCPFVLMHKCGAVNQESFLATCLFSDGGPILSRNTASLLLDRFPRREGIQLSRTEFDRQREVLASVA
jgi:hypothetical protein